jgi:hypothetical protein
MQNKINTRSNAAADLSIRARDLAARAEVLAADIAALHRDIRAADPEPVRRAGYRCETAVGWVRESAGYLRETSADLDRISAASTPGTCSIPWGVCPEHGNTLVSSGNKTWCQDVSCVRAWDYDRLSLPCAEPARWRMIDQHSDALVVCQGHAVDLRACLEGVRVVPLAVELPRGQA